MKNELIPGTLILKSKYHYGFNKRQIPYFLFKPINKDYPNFLVTFSKALKYNNNIYINIKYKEQEFFATIKDLYIQKTQFKI